MKKVMKKLAFIIVCMFALFEGALAAIDIPLNTWVARPIPSTGAPCKDGHCKHMRLTHNPVNGLIYVMGGDYAGDTPGFAQSSRNEMYTYSIKDDKWTLEQEYCRTDGTPQPAGPDQVGWAYDTQRNIFWMIPGYMADVSNGGCPDSTIVKGEVMTYDPNNKVWSSPGLNSLESLGLGATQHQYTQYDPVTDTLRMLCYTGGPCIATYDIKTDTWTKTNFAGNGRLNSEHTAFDITGRGIYAIDKKSTGGRFYRYDIDKNILEDLGEPPVEAYSAVRIMPKWDPHNKVVLVPIAGDGGVITFHVYHPDTKTWQKNIPINQPEGLSVQGITGTYDPYENVLMVMGVNIGDAVPYLFLYRYGDGTGVSDTLPPIAPSSLDAM